MIKKVKSWLVGVWLKNLNNFHFFFSKNFSNLSFFYLLIFTATWAICNYELQKMHIYNIKAQNILNYNEKYLIINNFINNCVEITHGIHFPEDKFILKLENSFVNNTIDIDLLYKIVEEKQQIKKETKKLIGLWEENFDLWKYFKKNSRNNITNFSKDTEFLEENKINFSILKKNKIKFFYGFSLLIISDFLLKYIFI